MALAFARVKPRRVHGNDLLVPELCKICGITEDMKTNRNFMKDLAVFTKLEP